MTFTKTTSNYNLLTIRETKSGFVTTTFCETINWSVLLKYLYSNNILRPTRVMRNKTFVYESERKMFEDILKKGMIEQNHKNKPIDNKLISLYYHNINKYLTPEIKVKYSCSSKCKTFGRVYPVGSLSLGCLRKELRGPMANDTYFDIDMVNCHSSILNEVFKNKYPILKDYVKSRSKYFELLGKHYNFDHTSKEGYKICKDLFSRTLYFSKYETWEKDHNLEPSQKIGFMVSLQAELNEMIKIIAENNQQLVKDMKEGEAAALKKKEDRRKMIKDKEEEKREIDRKNGINETEEQILIRVTAEENREKSEKSEDAYENFNGSLMSWFLGHHERQVLEKITEYFKKEKIIVKNNVVLSFDGEMVKKINLLEETNRNAMIKRAEVHVYNNLEINIELIVKPFDVSFYADELSKVDIPKPETDLEENEDEEEDENSFHCKSLKFEENHCKIVNKGVFIKTLRNENIEMSRMQMRNSYEDMTCKVYAKGKKKQGDFEEVNFIDKWLRNNPKQRKYEDSGIYPPDVNVPEGHFNTWRKFDMELIEDYEEKKKERDELFHHIKILCNHEEAVYEYFMKWIAQMIQYPSMKTVTPQLISKQGAGKGTLIRLLSKMLGLSKVFESRNSSEDVWGKFNGRMATAYLVVLDELSKKDTTDCLGQIKGLQTEPTMMINVKGVPAYEMSSYHRFLITTNGELGGITTDHNDRRNWIIRSSDEKIGDKDYFINLNKHLDDVNVVKTCYEYFNKVECMDSFITLKIPFTEYHKDLKDINISIIELWVKDFTIRHEDESFVTLLAREQFEEFNWWCSTNRIKYEINAIKFGLQLKILKLDGISYGMRTNKGQARIFNIALLQKHFNLGY